MNATNFIKIIPQLHPRQAGAAAAQAARNITLTAPEPSVPADLRDTALNIRHHTDCRDLAPLLKLAAWIFQPIAERKNIQLRLEAPDAGLYAICQEVRIQRVLENLLSNALRHAPAGSQVTLAARAEDGWLCIWVEDQGTGVPPALQSALFDGCELSFGESALGVNEDKHGLVVCKEIISANGGKILMYNRPEGGAHFEFHLPAISGPRLHSRNGTTTASANRHAVKLTPLFAAKVA